MTAETSLPALHVEGLSKTFGTKTVLRNVDLEVRRGETVVVIGASGSGKTTLLRCISHLELPTAGLPSSAAASGSCSSASTSPRT